MEGQVFVTSAIVFATLIVLASLPSGPSASGATGVREYFVSSQSQVPEAFNDALQQNSTTASVEREMYSYLWFVERLSSDRSIEFSAWTVSVYPSRGEATAINFQDAELDLSLRTPSGWRNTTVAARGSETLSFSGTGEFRVIEGEVDREFNASTPRVVNWMRMEGSNQVWQGARVG
jgi:hypothetical protein